MCARYTIRKKTLREVADALEAEYAEDDEPLYRARFNVAPTDLAWIVEMGGDRRVLRPATWSYLLGGRPLINLRAENVGSGSGYREAFTSRRCAVVTDGFYEWPPTKGNAPTFYHRTDDGLVLLGGLYQRPKGTDIHARFTVLTTKPNALVARVHDRMPVVLPAERLDQWLGAEPAEAVGLIGPAQEDALVATAVSKHVNSVKNDDPECVLPAANGPV